MPTARVIDVDQHLFEPRGMWRDSIDPAHREDALAIEDDERGYPWLTWRGRRLYLAEVQEPGNARAIGDLRQRLARGEPAEARYEDLLPPSYHDPKARLEALDEFGIEAAALFPNFGLLWEEMLADDVGALCANMRAANRWMAGAAAAGGGRLFGVAHLTLRDPQWVREELRRLEAAGIRLAMIAPAPAGGVALGDPSLDPLWAAFCEHGVAPVFHVGGFRKPFDPAWYAADPEPVDKVLDSVLLWVPAAVALAHMAIHGAFARHPDLRVGVVELTAHWLPEFLVMLDGAHGFYVARHGEPPTSLPERPSAYIRSNVRVAALAYEQPARLVGLAGEDSLMYGSDWPHAEGLPRPLEDYRAACGDLTDSAREKLFGGNARWLLRLDGG